MQCVAEYLIVSLWYCFSFIEVGLLVDVGTVPIAIDVVLKQNGGQLAPADLPFFSKAERGNV